MPEIRDLFLKGIELRMIENLDRLRICTNILEEDQLWEKPNASLNSAGNLLLHLNGNIQQYLLSGLTASKDARVREEEFNDNQKIEKEILWEMHCKKVRSSLEVLNNLTDDSLKAVYHIQGFELCGIDVLIHVVEHYSYHTGQIALLTKLFTNKDLGFYQGKDLNKPNK
ncbi:MAG: DinB family protein [Vicingaceae bacterium]